MLSGAHLSFSRTASSFDSIRCNVAATVSSVFIVCETQELLHRRSAFAFTMLLVMPELPHPAMVISGFRG
jgi:hypothetical protein